MQKGNIRSKHSPKTVEIHSLLRVTEHHFYLNVRHELFPDSSPTEWVVTLQSHIKLNTFYTDSFLKIEECEAGCPIFW